MGKYDALIAYKAPESTGPIGVFAPTMGPPSPGKYDRLAEATTAQTYTTPEEPISKYKSAAEGLASGVTLGAWPKMLAAMTAVPGSIGSQRPYGQVYQQFADEYQAEQDAARQANPKSYMAGDIASYFTPGGSAKAFKVGAQAAEKALAKSTIKNPLLKKIATDAASTGAGMAAVGAGREIGTNIDQSVDPIALAKEAAVQGAIGAVTGPILNPVASKVIGGISQFLKAAAYKMGKTPYEALREWAVNPELRKQVAAAAYKEQSMGEDLAGTLQNAGKEQIPEYTAAMQALQNIPAVPIGGTLKTLAKYVEPKAPEEEAVAAKVSKWLTTYIPKYQPKSEVSMEMGVGPKGAPENFFINTEGGPFITGPQAETLKRSFQQGAKGAYGMEGAPLYAQIEREAGQQLRKDIQEMTSFMAEGPGAVDAGKYVSGMQVTSKKLGALNAVKKIVGKDVGNWEARSERLIKNAKVIDGVPNKEMKVLNVFDKNWGTDYAKQAYAAKLARKIGGPSPAIMPQWQTGGMGFAALPGIAASAATGIGTHSIEGALAGIPLLLAASPRVQSGVISAFRQPIQNIPFSGLPLSGVPTANIPATIPGALYDQR
jgi:hypothetical protein